MALGNSVLGIENFFSGASLDDGFLNMIDLKEITLVEKVSLLPDFFQENGDDSDFFLTGRYQKITLNSADDEVIER